MKGLTRRTTPVFSGPFSVLGFEKTLPTRKHDIETERCSPLDTRFQEGLIVTKLHPPASRCGLTRTLNVNLDKAKDKLSTRERTDSFLEKMLADPLTRLVMEADGVSEAQLRHFYSVSRTSQMDNEVLNST
jgi:hypothetical protein